MLEYEESSSGSLKTERRLVLDRVGTGVGRQDQDRVPEIDAPTETVGQTASSNTCKRILKISGCAFSISSSRTTEYDDGGSFRSAGRLVVPDVSRRGTDQTADRVLLHKLAHVDRDQGIFVAEHKFGKCLGQERFPTPVGGEDKADRTGGDPGSRSDCGGPLSISPRWPRSG